MFFNWNNHHEHSILVLLLFFFSFFSLYLLQIVIKYVIPAAKRNGSGHSKSTLALIVLIQYVPRLFVIFPLNQQIIKTTGFIAKTAWAGAAYNLLLFMLASHVNIHAPLFHFGIWYQKTQTRNHLTCELCAFSSASCAGGRSFVVCGIYRKTVLLLVE